MIIKVCGLRDSANIAQVANLGVDWTGLIFYSKSPRCVTKVPVVPNSVKRVGVFVNEEVERVAERAQEYGLHLVQLHGVETQNYIDSLRELIPDYVKVIKAVSVSSVDDINVCYKYNDVDYFLFDTKSKCVGGSGLKFDWSVLESYRGDIPFLLSGGIGIDDAESILEFKHKCFVGVDLNSKFETEPGYKDIELLEKFIKRLRHI